MGKHKRLSWYDSIAIMLIIIFAIAILIPARGRIACISRRIICNSNLKNIGISMKAYSQDYEGLYPQLPGNGPWSRELGFAYDKPAPDFSGTQANTSRTVTASLYLLVRYSNANTDIFVCPETSQSKYTLEKDTAADITALWDFGSEPYKHVSFVMQHPYGKFPSHANLPATFAITADMSPWFVNGNILSPGGNGGPHQIFNPLDRNIDLAANSQNHRVEGKRPWEETKKFWNWDYRAPGQNVLYADGHCVYQKLSNVGVNNDNIYTFWSTEKNPTQQDIRKGTAPNGRNPENDAKSKEDSFLVI